MRVSTPPAAERPAPAGPPFRTLSLPVAAGYVSYKLSGTCILGRRARRITEWACYFGRGTPAPRHCPYRLMRTSHTS